MGLRGKLIALFFVVLTLTCGVGIEILIENLGSDFTALERNEAMKLTDQLVRNFKSELEHLNELNTDWANWGGMYNFANTLAPDFAEAELATSSLGSAKLSVVAILNQKDKITYLRTASDLVDHESNLALSKALSSSQRLYEAKGITKACTVQAVEGELFLLCWQQIHRSDGSGDPRGTLVTGRALSERVLRRMRNQSALDFDISEIFQPIVPNQSAIAGSTVSTDSLTVSGADTHLLSGRLLDAFSVPVLRFRIRLPADIERSGRQITWRVVMVVTLAALLSSLALLLGVQYFLVRRLKMMELQLRDVGAAGGWPNQIATEPGRDEIATLGDAINRMLRVMREQGQALELLSLTDPLTRLANRRAFDRSITSGISLSNRNNAPLSLLVLDVDHFKAYNDLFGHPAGDAVLAAIGKLLSEAAHRPSDLAARIGGEEFAILLPGTTLEGANRVATKIHEALAEKAIPHAGSLVGDRVTVSIGVTQFMCSETAAEFIARADKATYAAKRAGRNRSYSLVPSVD